MLELSELGGFEGVSSTTVILAPGACRRGALSNTSCVGNMSVCAVCDEFQEARFCRQARHFKAFCWY